MTRTDIVNAIIKDDNYKNLCRRIDPSGDLYQNFILFLLEMPEQKLIERWTQPGFTYFAVRIITQPRKLAYSDEAWKRRAVHGQEVDIPDEHYNIDIDRTALVIKKELDKLPAGESGFSYDRELFNLHLDPEFKSLLKISKATGIPYRSVKTSIRGTKQLIKSKVQDPSDRTA